MLLFHQHRTQTVTVRILRSAVDAVMRIDPDHSDRMSHIVDSHIF